VKAEDTPGFVSHGAEVLELEFLVTVSGYTGSTLGRL